MLIFGRFALYLPISSNVHDVPVTSRDLINGHASAAFFKNASVTLG